jgi:hypothetical protein
MRSEMLTLHSDIGQKTSHGLGSALKSFPLDHFLHVEVRRRESFDDRFGRLRNAKAIFPRNPIIIGVASVL